MLVELERTTYLGPARVRQVAGVHVQVELSDRCIWARTALASPYQVTEDDVVLVLGNGDSWYVIGLLKGSGMTTWAVPGNLAIRAPHGSIDVHAAQGIRIQGPIVRVLTNRLEMVADRVCERFGRATRWVKDLLHLRVGRCRTEVDTTYAVKAGSIVERANGVVKIDGRKIHLG